MAGQNVPQTLDEAYKLAAEAKPYLDAFGEELVRKFGCEFVPAPLKGRERAEEKLAVKYHGDLSRLQDIARCRVVCDSLEQIDLIKKAVKEHAVPLREVDRLDNPNERGYRDLKYVFPEKNGFACEMQIQLKDFAEANERTHLQYEKVRSITAAAKDRPLTEREQKEIAVREKICQRIFMKAALNYNERTTGRKLKIPQEQKPFSMAALKAKAAGAGR